MSAAIVSKYFPDLSEKQLGQVEQLGALYREWNEKINVISRKDIENLYLHHVLHSLAIAKYIRFTPGSQILDLGTGGGFPGIPLAVLFPDVRFWLIDGTLKKIKVVQEVAQALELKNAVPQHSRAEELKGLQFDFVVSRAVAPIDKLYLWSYRLIKAKHQNSLPNGILALKGGNLRAELKALPKGAYFEQNPLSDIFDHPYFEEKYLIYVQK